MSFRRPIAPSLLPTVKGVQAHTARHINKQAEPLVALSNLCMA